ncbi:MAG: FlgD immunoglobulin-like domain containing protein [Candidatus Glassbacteria bacterium]
MRNVMGSRATIAIVVVVLGFISLFPSGSIAQLEGTARDYYGPAEQAAENWSPDSELLYVLGTGEEMHLSGEALLWTYLFESATEDSLLLVAISLGLPLIVEEIWDTISILEPLPEEWIDSDVSISVAEANGGSHWRETYDSNLIVATAGKGLYLPDLLRPVWLIAYTDTTQWLNSIGIYVDALTGEFIDSVGLGIEDQPGETQKAPKTFTLGQNYPNPFNPGTTLTYTVPEGEARHVALEVYDVRGQKVRTLFDGMKEPGVYVIHWDGRDEKGGKVGSGIYLAGLRSGKEVSIRKMVLVK